MLALPCVLLALGASEPASASASASAASSVCTLPPRTSVRSDGCCTTSVNSTAPAVPCSAAATPFGDCAQARQFPKILARFHVMDRTCDENDVNAPFYFRGVYHGFYQKHCAIPVPGEVIKGIVYGHVVSSDLVHWAHLPVAIWNDQPYDRYAIYSGSATVIDFGDGGRPFIIYPGLSLHDEWPACPPKRANFVQAVPTNLSDPLLISWQKPGYNPIHNGSAKDPSAAWETAAGGEWRFSDNAGAIYSSSDFARWRLLGLMGDKNRFPTGDCPSLFKLPRRTPGTGAAPAGVAQPTHVHICSGSPFGSWAQVGHYVDGAPHTPGLWYPTAASPCLQSKPRATACGRSIDRGQTYAAKNFEDPKNNRTLLWTNFNGKPNASNALIRDVTWNAELQQLEFAPIEEQAQLRDVVLAERTNVTVAAGAELLLSSAAWRGRGNTSEIECVFQLPPTTARFGVVVMGAGKNSAAHSGTYFSIDYEPQTNSAVVAACAGGSATKCGSNPLPVGWELDALACPEGANASSCRPVDLLRLSPSERTLSLRIFTDLTFAEAYFQRGRSVLTVGVEPSAIARYITILAAHSFRYL